MVAVVPTATVLDAICRASDGSGAFESVLLFARRFHIGVEPVGPLWPLTGPADSTCLFISIAQRGVLFELVPSFVVPGPGVLQHV